MEYKIKEVLPRIFAVEVEDNYDRAMLFLRSQEFYESPFEDFRGHHFEMFEFMDRYRKWKGLDYFSYPEDWGGFNVPGELAETCTKHAIVGYDMIPTKYDYIMHNIIRGVKAQVPDGEKYYLLGVDSFESSITMQHELAHGLYYVNDAYKQEMAYLVTNLPLHIHSAISTILIDMGYCDDVIADEIQAYMATGLMANMSEIPGIEDELNKFEQVFNNFK